MALNERVALGRKLLAHAAKITESFQFFSDWLVEAPEKIQDKLATVEKGADGRATAINLAYGRIDIHYRYTRSGEEPEGRILFVKPSDGLQSKPIILKQIVINAAGYVYFDEANQDNAFEWNSNDELIARNLIRLAYELAIAWTDAPLTN